MEETKYLDKAFTTFDSELLLKALDAGEDLNVAGRPGEHLWQESLFDYAQSEEQHDDTWPLRRDRIEKFLTIAVQHGLDLDSYDEDGDYEHLSDFYQVVRYCCNDDLDFLQFLIDLGVNLNHVVSDGLTELESLVDDIFAEECCGYKDGAKWYYEASRLLIKNGAKCYRVLYPDDKAFGKDPTDFDGVKQEILASRLDLGALEKLSPERIASLKLDYCALVLSQYYFPHEFYAHTKAFQKHIADYLSKVMDKIGLEKMWNGLLEACVELQYPDVMEFLLNAGIDPNINCFNEHYRYVSSSALFTLDQRGYLIPPDMRDRMEKMLLEHGATLRR